MRWETADPTLYDVLKENAAHNRKNPTEAEAALWGLLSGKQLGAKFLRQHIIGDYIVDFLCRKNNLIIEVDGGYHNDPRQQEDDLQRTRWLESQGYHVMRFTNEQVLFDIQNVINNIKKDIQ